MLQKKNKKKKMKRISLQIKLKMLLRKQMMLKVVQLMLKNRPTNYIMKLIRLMKMLML